MAKGKSGQATGHVAEPLRPAEVGEIAGKPSKITESTAPIGLETTDVGHAPFIAFDGAPVLGFADGTVRITLTALRSIPAFVPGGVQDSLVVVGYLRCGIDAATALRNNLDKALLLAAEPHGQTQ